MAAATLSAATATPTSQLGVTLAVTSNQATGTIYAVITDSATPPSHAQLVAGTDGDDDPALYASSKAGAASNTFLATVTTRYTAPLYAHFGQANGGAEESTPVSTLQFWLHDVNAGTLSDDTSSSVCTLAYPVIRCSGDFGGGTATPEYQSAIGTWIALTDGAMASAGQKLIQFPRPRAVRVTLSGSTAAALLWEIC